MKSMKLIEIWKEEGMRKRKAKRKRKRKRRKMD